MYGFVIVKLIKCVIIKQHKLNLTTQTEKKTEWRRLFSPHHKYLPKIICASTVYIKLSEILRKGKKIH